MIQFDKRICSDSAAARSREWLETNGLGGFASSTIIGLNTRRYHGLLVAAIKPPTGRMLLLSKLEETVVVGEHRYELGANRYPGVIHPTGYEYLREFRLDPFPIFIYEVGGFEIEKSVFMIQGENSTVVQYRLHRSEEAENAAVSLELRPLIGFRDCHTPRTKTVRSILRLRPATASSRSLHMWDCRSSTWLTMAGTLNPPVTGIETSNIRWRGSAGLSSLKIFLTHAFSGSI